MLLLLLLPYCVQVWPAADQELPRPPQSYPAVAHRGMRRRRVCFRLGSHLGFSLGPAVDSSADQHIHSSTAAGRLREPAPDLRQARMRDAATHRICSRDKHSISNALATRGPNKDATRKCRAARSHNSVWGPRSPSPRTGFFKRHMRRQRPGWPAESTSVRTGVPQILGSDSVSPPTPDLGWVLPLPRCRCHGNIFKDQPMPPRTFPGLHNWTRQVKSVERMVGFFHNRKLKINNRGIMPLNIMVYGMVTTADFSPSQ
jgi:hypothetical protein